MGHDLDVSFCNNTCSDFHMEKAVKGHIEENLGPKKDLKRMLLPLLMKTEIIFE